MKILARITLVPLFFTLFLGCIDNRETEILEESPSELSIEDRILALPNNEFVGPELITLYSEAMKEVLEMSKDADFRGYIYKKTLLQDGGDYNVYLDDIVKSYRSNQTFGKSAMKLKSLAAKITDKEGGLRPVVFFPKAETLENKTIANKGFDTAKAMKEPIAVMKGAHDSDYSVPGYKLTDGKLLFDRNVTEEDAWENDVYVIGAEELVAPVDCESYVQSDCGGGGGGGGGGSSTIRTEGRRELGGEIRIHNLNTVEHWVSGKLEMRVLVGGGLNGGVTLIDFKYPQVKRSNFQNGKWYNFGSFYFNWNTPVIGMLNIEQWWELDGGTSVSSTITIPGMPATSTTPATPSTSITFPSKDKDDRLTTAPVQFTDNTTEVYGAGNLYFKRN